MNNCYDAENLQRIKPRTRFTHFRADNVSSSAAPARFTQCYLMLKATRNGFDLCIYSPPPCITLPSGKQLWQTLMKNMNWKLNYLNADSSSTHRRHRRHPSICKITLHPGSAEHWAECSSFEASIKVVAGKIENCN